MLWPFKKFGGRAAGIENHGSAGAQDKEGNGDLSDASIREIASAINSVANQLGANEEKQESAERKRGFREKITIGLVLLTFAAAAGGDWIFYQTMVDAGRAWLAPRTVYLTEPLTLGQHPEFRLAYDNVERGPALDTLLMWQTKTVDGDALTKSLREQIPFKDVFGDNVTCSGYQNRQGAEPIWPSATGENYSQFHMAPKDDPIVNQFVLDGRAAVVVFGCYFYKTFGELHHSGFCFWNRQTPGHPLTKKDAFYMCPIGNDIN